jgi:hypothetical protein
MQAQYEDWLCDLHPEMRWRDDDGAAVAALIDQRFYVRSSDHLALWNRTSCPGGIIPVRDDDENGCDLARQVAAALSAPGTATASEFE